MAEAKKQELSVVIPCYNEKKTIEAIVDKVREADIDDLEIIVVDNCSDDGTREIIQTKIEPKVSRVIYNETNIGKGGSVHKGYAAATKDIVVVQDADLEYDPVENYPRLIEPILAGEADAVYGSRFMNRTGVQGNLMNFIGNKVFTFCSNRMTGLRLTDMETCYKAIRRDVIQTIDLKENGFGFEPEITAKLAAKKCRIVEIPISYHPRSSSEGKKVKFRHGLWTLYCIFKYRKG